MPISSQIYDQLHVAVYDATGWALPDNGLRELASHLPAPLWVEVERVPRRTWLEHIRQWCENQRELVDRVVHQLQAHPNF